jgi:aspartyl-tRNA(Asn)/glutamyl-tRNA(Gln) amidotransferase subunit A
MRAVAEVERAFQRIEADQPRLNAWLALDREGARTAAAEVDRRSAAGEALGKLGGRLVGLKDMICTQGVATTAASRILGGFIPPYEATVVERLRAAGAIVLGKTNQDEFAMGSSSESSAFGAVRNPRNLERVAGGSSGGSAAAVAAGHCQVALGTDTGGSIRQPAAMCGVVGVKPTYGRVSRYGIVAFASSLDQVGPLGRTVRDCAEVLQVIAGHDPRDATSLPAAVPDWVSELNRPVAGLRLGVPQEYFGPGVAPAVIERTRAALHRFEALGARLIDVALPHTEYAVAAYYVLAPAEASSNLARYDGVRYGHRTARPLSSIDDLYSWTRAEGFGTEVKRRILLGTFALSSGYYDAYYRKAQKVRTLVAADFHRAFEVCDLLAAPTSPVTAWRLGERVDDPLSMYLMDSLTIPASLAGLPCLSMPCGEDPEGLPVGLQLIGPPLQEGRILAAAHALEEALA